MVALVGNEILYVVPIQANGQPGAILEQVTTGQVAALSSNFSNDGPTAVSNTTGTTLLASALLTGLINRTGPTANFTDTTDTAASIALAVGATNYPVSFYIDIKNATPFIQTISAGTGVTFSSNNILPGNSLSEYLVVLASATAATFNHVFTAAIDNTTLEVATALTTVGAGTITGVGIAGRVTTRGGAQAGAAFTDTTDTAANIIAGQPNAHLGDSWEYVYQNTTNAVATISGGTGVTVSGITVVPPSMAARYLVTYTAAGTVTLVGLSLGVTSGAVGTFTANGVTGVVVAATAVTSNSSIIFTAKTIGGTPAGAPFLSSVTPGTGFTVKAAAGDTSVYNYLIIG